MSKDDTTALAAFLGATINLFVTSWLLSFCVSWLFPMVLLPYWKWLVITLTVQSLCKSSNYDS